MRNDRTGRGKYQSKAAFLRFAVLLLRGPTSPQLLSAHQGKVPAYPRWNTASNSPGSLLSQTECRPLSQRRCCNMPHADGKVDHGGVKVNTLPRWRRSDTRGGNGEKVTRKMGSWKTQLVGDKSTQSRKPDDARRLMSRFTLSTLCQFWCFTIKAKHLIYVFSTNYCKGYCFSCEPGLCI